MEILDNKNTQTEFERKVAMAKRVAIETFGEFTVAQDPGWVLQIYDRLVEDEEE